MPVNRVRPRRRTHGPAGLLLLLVLSALGLGLAPLPASAAAGGLQSSTPDARQEAGDAPGWVTLVFDGVVDGSVAKVLVVGPDGAGVTTGPLIVESTNVTTQLKDGLAQGTYTVHYRVDGQGGTPRGGAFQFSYGRGSFSDLPDASWSGAAQEPEILRGNDPDGPENTSSPDRSPGVEVTSSERTERTTEPAPPTRTEDPADPTVTDEPGSAAPTDPTDPSDPSRSGSGSAVPAPDPVRRAFLLGGVALLLVVAGAVFGFYRSSRSGKHS